MKVHHGPQENFFYTIILISDARLCHMLAFVLVIEVVIVVLVEEGETDFPHQYLQLLRTENHLQWYEKAFLVDNIVMKKKAHDMAMVESW